jgi:hypothetical protein
MSIGSASFMSFPLHSQPVFATSGEPAAEATDVAEVAGVLPAATATAEVSATIDVTVALRDFVRVLARAAARRDWDRALTDISTGTTNPCNTETEHE